MDTRLSCFIWGIIGVIFGLVTLLYPDPEIMLATFYGLFLVLVVLGIAIFLLLAITSRGDESLVLFGCSAGLLILAVLSFLAREIVGIIFMIIIAGIAFFNGFTDITLALTHPRTKYILIPGMFIHRGSVPCGTAVVFPRVVKKSRHRNSRHLCVCLWAHLNLYGIFPDKGAGLGKQVR